MEPGEQLINGILTGRVNGDAVGRLIFSLLPALPHETGGIPIPVPRSMVQQVYGRTVTVTPVPSQVAPAQPVPPPAPTVYVGEPITPQPADAARQPTPQPGLARGGMKIGSPTYSVHIARALRSM